MSNLSKQTTATHQGHQGDNRLTHSCRSRWKKYRTKYEYDPDRLEHAHKLAMYALHQYYNPSCFKAAAALTIGVCAARPFNADLPVAFKEINNYSNALFAILESVYWLHGAELLISSDTIKKLEHPIEFSDHFFRELVATCGRLGTIIDPKITYDVPESCKVQLRTLALTYEALAYQKNQECKYEPPKALQIDKYFNILSS